MNRKNDINKKKAKGNIGIVICLILSLIFFMVTLLSELSISMQVKNVISVMGVIVVWAVGMGYFVLCQKEEWRKKVNVAAVVLFTATMLYVFFSLFQRINMNRDIVMGSLLDIFCQIV